MASSLMAMGHLALGPQLERAMREAVPGMDEELATVISKLFEGGDNLCVDRSFGREMKSSSSMTIIKFTFEQDVSLVRN